MDSNKSESKKDEIVDDNDISPAARIPKFVLDSQIYNGEEISFLMDQLKESTESQDLFFELVYRASRDGDSKFHDFCDEQGPNISLIRTNKGKVIGGYSKNSWNKSGGFSNDPTSFLFSITNKKIWKIKNKIYATYNVDEIYIMIIWLSRWNNFIYEFFI